ncbi:MAG: CPBP family intramembrane metalloprotease [Bradyrhizobiaceae bacterium]|nr:CPBP family intramembrane metalloprotease [Bradyrhizobiaceae bacterium]
MSVLQHWGFRLLSPFACIALVLSVSVYMMLDGPTTSYVMYAAILIQLVLVERFRPGGSYVSSGITITPSFPRLFLTGVGLALTALTIILAAAFALGATFGTSDAQVQAATIIGLAFSSAGEEFLFRGTMFEALRERYGQYVAVGITSVLFGLAHAMNPGISLLAVVNVVLAGILLGALVATTGSLWPSILFHVGWNVSVQSFFGTVSGTGSSGWVTTMDVSNVAPSNVWLVTGPFGIEQGICTTIVLCAAIVAVVVYARPDGTVRAARFRRDHQHHHA